MFWNMDVGEQEQDLMEISHFLLSVFEFAKNHPISTAECPSVKWKVSAWRMAQRTWL